ncbi:MAG: Stk1 family PASTA domain-containing Ser/Thr kinase [Lachnospiraceae bacterium]|nr:Stk1 family PASTA domain-containing Ser/Thr kinase [Lachnospiraceae bacterium]
MVKDGIFLGNRYEVLSKIGAGGMADVYKGKDTMLNRYVAIKVLKKEYREDENFVRKFRSEAQAAAGLLNPNVVNVYDVGEDRGLYYMVMELVEGITLKEYIERKGRLSHKEIISIAIQMCTGIGAAHAANIIHRDIKPQNVIISRDGKVKVTDFGIAKAVTSNTISTNAMGSVHYTSPEQARGGFSDAKSDIYSIGITLYEMATGQVPFDGDSTVAVAMKHLQQEITPPSELVPDIPYSLEQIILKCTQKNGERRYPNTTQLIQDLKRSLVDPEGDFVVIPPLGNADTVIITDDELDDIRSNYDGKGYGDDYDDDDYEDDGYSNSGYGDDYDVDGYGDETGRIKKGYGDDYDDEDDYDDGDDRKKSRKKKGGEDINPGMRKLTKILMAVVIVIILFIAIFAIGKATGLFKGFDKGITAEEDDDKVKVPNVIGMTEEDAKETLNKKGLGCHVSYEESEKYDKGVVCDQKTEAGKEVDKNTRIEIVVSSKKAEEEIKIPNVSGMDESEAQRTLEAKGLTVGTSQFVYSGQVAEGEVIETTPAAGTSVTADQEVIMKVSKGEEKQAVPSVVGKSESEAQSAIKGAGLSVSAKYEYSDDVEKGYVISQSPYGGNKVNAGTTVYIVVSKGQKPEDKIQVKNFAGSDEEDLLAWASENGLNASKIRGEYSNNYEEGMIISMTPSSGKVTKGSTIRYVLSLGQKPSDDDNEGETEPGED